MTIPELLSILFNHRTIVYLAIGVVPLVTFILGFLHGVYDARKAPWRQLYSLIIFLTTLFVTALAAAIGYVYLLGGDPLAVMGYPFPSLVLGSWLLTLLVVKRVVDLKHLSGFPRVIPFVIELAVVWGAGLGVLWTERWFVFNDPMLSLLAAAGIAFVVLHPFFMAATRRSRS